MHCFLAGIRRIPVECLQNIYCLMLCEKVVFLFLMSVKLVLVKRQGVLHWLLRADTRCISSEIIVPLKYSALS